MHPEFHWFNPGVVSREADADSELLRQCALSGQMDGRQLVETFGCGGCAPPVAAPVAAAGITAGNSQQESLAPDAWLSRDGKKALTTAEREARIESGQFGIARDYPTALYRADAPCGNTPYDEGPFSLDHERNAFEAAMRDKHPEWAFTRDPVFDYHNERTRCAWEAWKAARSHGVTVPDHQSPANADGSRQP